MPDSQGMKTFFCLLFLLCALPAFAADKSNVPELVFAQQVNIVVSAKQDPRIYDLKITQKEDVIHMDMIVDKNVEREQAKAMAGNVIMLAKGLSLDDPPKDKDKQGKGLYNYELAVTKPDGVTLLNASKPKDKESISFEDPNPVLEPLTHAGATGQ